MMERAIEVISKYDFIKVIVFLFVILHLSNKSFALGENMYFWVPIVGPIIGAIVGGFVFDKGIRKYMIKDEESVNA